jgi:deazaflavin-dependent oxidoreductase (nitroreductase family)
MDIRDTNRRVIEQFRSGGPVEGMNREGLVLITTTGRVSGLPRTTPMMFIEDHGRIVVVASNIGAAEHPQWYRNLLADPSVIVEVGDRTYAATAVTLVGDERARVWSQLVEGFPFFNDHQTSTTREIPLVRLDPAETLRSGGKDRDNVVNPAAKHGSDE